MSTPITQELIYFTARDGHLHYRLTHHPLPDSTAPNEDIRRTVGWDIHQPEGATIHSTSWRYDDNFGLVLTWAITPDPKPDGSVRVPSVGVAQSLDATRPVPDELNVIHVVNHAARHLAFLLHTDPTVGDALHRHRELHDALLATHPAVAGNPHA